MRHSPAGIAKAVQSFSAYSRHVARGSNINSPSIINSQPITLATIGKLIVAAFLISVKQPFDFMESPFETENHDSVAGLDNSVTAYEHTAAVAHETCDSHVVA